MAEGISKDLSHERIDGCKGSPGKDNPGGTMTASNSTKPTRSALFVAEYLVDLNATKAAERAGYSKRTARSQGNRLLTKADIQKAVQAGMDRRAEKIGITAERVLDELALLGFANMLDYITVGPNGSAVVDLSKLTRAQAAAISEIVVEEFTERTGVDENGKPIFENVRRTRFKLTDKRAALVDLGRHLKLFTDRVEVDDPAEREIQDVKQKLLAKLKGHFAGQERQGKRP